MLFSRTVVKFAFLNVAAGVDLKAPSAQHILENEDLECSRATETPLNALLDIFETMQQDFFAPWLGTWPTAIDWTAAVMETHASGALTTLSRALDLLPAACRWADKTKENTVTLYFSEILSFYFSQDHFAIRNEAYDDILWVVLGWLETIQFINLHTSMTSDQVFELMRDYTGSHGHGGWYGKIWIPAFAHRARIFWNLARQGWDRNLCGGGMVWNPRLEPYKNAITNQLFISASSAMYLHFPGDWNHAPFFSDADVTSPDHFSRPSANDVFNPSDPTFRNFAMEGYRWLEASNMMNTRGLYIDGFHISGWKDPKSSNKKCDVRNEQVYTYNQGVILTGQLNLWKITGNYSYVEDGHRLISSVIAATGWDLSAHKPIDDNIPSWDDILNGWRWTEQKLPRWHGLGRAGVIEEACDSKGDCSQDAQTFKGIFFHHLTTFCGTRPSRDDFMETNHHTDEHIALHSKKCRAYTAWLQHNVFAMQRTKNAEGKVGMWWTAGLLGLQKHLPSGEDFTDLDEPGAVDYRNDGVPDDPMWRRTPTGVTPPLMPLPRPEQARMHAAERMILRHDDEGAKTSAAGQDLNDRGRGRTVETQGGGLALLRAYWEIVDFPEKRTTTKANECQKQPEPLEPEL
ncbi:hypothetical protein N0V93_003282 [Gnomoniopsis smithogilvyi]|uniref:Glycosyl hydrolase n=1 Tax=Gnomoniopsis smithogilvyi TaxID=1191159 RepID=A0A9W8YWC7_9PEZI|nr:hypothetical protein N0V93_003282 [Gnomoniopsis smithogilvyi]